MQNPRVFYGPVKDENEEPPRRNSQDAYDSGSEAETDVEESPARTFKRLHRRTESFENAEANTIHKRRKSKPVAAGRVAAKEARDVSGRLPLQRACEKGNIRAARELIAKGANVNDRDYAGTAVLHSAALKGETEIVKLLLEHGAIVDIRSGPDELDTPLIDAVSNGHISTVKTLLSHGSDPRIANAAGETASDFLDEDQEDGVRIAKMLRLATDRARERGPLVEDPRKLPKGTFPPLKSVPDEDEDGSDDEASRNATSRGRRWLTNETMVDLCSKSGRRQVTKKAAQGDLEFVGTALEQGWAPTAEALVLAAKHGHTDIVGLLLAYGSDVDTIFEGETALHATLGRGHLATVKLLLESGANISWRDASGKSYRRLVDELKVEGEERTLIYEKSGATLKESKEPKASKETIMKDLPKPTESNGKYRPELTIKPEPDIATDGKTRTYEPTGPQAGEDGKATASTVSPKSPIAPDSGQNQNQIRENTPKEITKTSSRPELHRRSSGSPKSPKTGISEFQKQPGPKPAVAPERKEISFAKLPSFERKRVISPSTISPSTPISKLGSRSASPRPKEPAEQPSLPQHDSNNESIERGETKATRDREGSTELARKLEELATRREKERKMREEKMLKALAEQESREAASSATAATVTSAAASSVDPTASTTQEREKTAEPENPLGLDHYATSVFSTDKDADTVMATEPGSNGSVEPALAVSSNAVPAKEVTPQADSKKVADMLLKLPHAVRELARTGKAQDVLPLLAVCRAPSSNSTPVNFDKDPKSYSIMDLQLALATGKAQINQMYPGFERSAITSKEKDWLWNFVADWLVAPGSSGIERVAERERFKQLPLAWIRGDDAQLVLSDAAVEQYRVVVISSAPGIGVKPRAVSNPVPAMKEFDDAQLNRIARNLPLRYAVKLRMRQTLSQWE